MNTIYLDSPMAEGERRERIYQGQLFVFSPRPAALALCELAREMLEEAFAPLHPPEAQSSLPVERFARILGDLKPRFAHHPRAKPLVKAVLEELGCDLDKTCLDVPRVRAVTHGGYLSTGVGYVHQLHRDTWYAAPLCQLNWWMPVYPIESESALAFHPHYWARAVRNGSSRFNYYQWNVERTNVARHIASDTRYQPHAEEPLTIDPQVRPVSPPGGVLLFSGAQMHSTAPNTTGRTRFSIDFRTVNEEDVRTRRGAPNVDSFPVGTSLRDFLRASDLERLPEDVIRLYEPEPPAAGVVIFEPQLAAAERSA